MVIPPYPPWYALIRTVVASFFVTFISFTLLFSYHPPFKTTLSKFSPFSTPPYTSAIIYLVWLFHPDELLELLASVNAYLLLRDPWPIILFHTGDFDETPVQDDFLASLREKVGGWSNCSAGDFSDPVDFIKLDWVLPERIADTMEKLDPISPSSWPGMSHTKFFLCFITHSLPLHHFMNYLCFAQVIITCVHSTPQKYSSIHAYEMSRTTTHGYQFSLPWTTLLRSLHGHARSPMLVWIPWDWEWCTHSDQGTVAFHTRLRQFTSWSWITVEH